MASDLIFLEERVSAQGQPVKKATYEPLSALPAINMSTLPSNSTVLRPFLSAILPAKVGGALMPTMCTERVLPSACCLSKVLTAFCADFVSLNVTRMRTSRAVDTAFDETMSPHRLKMAATSSFVVP